MAYALNSDQEDALQERANVAMGRAGASLGIMLDSFVKLSVPRARIIAANEAVATLSDMLDAADEVIAVRQSFFNLLHGEAMIIYGSEGCAGLADLLGHDGTPDQRLRQELLLDISNLLVGAVLEALGEQLAGEFGYTSPEILATCHSLAELLHPPTLRWAHALLIEVNFSLEVRGFRCHMVLLMPEDSIGLMLTAVDRILAEL